MQRTCKIRRAKTIILSFLFFGLLTSCDCIQQLQGYAIDAETREPLSEVYYTRDSLLTEKEKLVDINDPLYHFHRKTDSVGWFLDFRLSDGLTCKPPLGLWFEKEGYEPLRVESSRDKGLDTLVVKMHKKGSH